MLRPTPGDPWGVEQHHWNTGAEENQQLNPGGPSNRQKSSVIFMHKHHKPRRNYKFIQSSGFIQAIFRSRVLYYILDGRSQKIISSQVFNFEFINDIHIVDNIKNNLLKRGNHWHRLL